MIQVDEEDGQQVMSDGRSVWLNVNHICCARFGPTGQEVLAPVRVFVKHPPEGPDLDHWKSFVLRVEQQLGIRVHEKHRPLALMPN